METTLYVSNLADGTKPAQLADLFRPFGRLVDKVTVRKKAGLLFAFVRLEVADEAAEAHCLASLHNSLQWGLRLRVERAKSASSEQSLREEERRQQLCLEQFEAKAKLDAEVAAAADEERQEEERKREKRQRLEQEARQAAPAKKEAPKPQLLPKTEEKPQQQKKKQKKNKRSGKDAKRVVKVRERVVPDVAKATSWDAVLGHKWEEKHENTFSLLATIGQDKMEKPEEEAEREERPQVDYRLAASRHFFRKTNPDLLNGDDEDKKRRALANPNLKRFEQRLNDQAGAAAHATPAGVLNIDTEGEAFVRNDDELDSMMKTWRSERPEFRKDFQQKKRKMERNQQTMQYRRK